MVDENAFLVSICRIESVCDCSALDASSVIKFT